MYEVNIGTLLAKRSGMMFNRCEPTVPVLGRCCSYYHKATQYVWCTSPLLTMTRHSPYCYLLGLRGMLPQGNLFLRDLSVLEVAKV